MGDGDKHRGGALFKSLGVPLVGSRKPQRVSSSDCFHIQSMWDKGHSGWGEGGRAGLGFGRPVRRLTWLQTAVAWTTGTLMERCQDAQ